MIKSDCPQICPACRSSISHSDKVCPKCGKDLRMDAFIFHAKGAYAYPDYPEFRNL